MVEHKGFSLATDVKVCFCDPEQPWQRGSDENINGLLRQYFPKGIDLPGINQNRLQFGGRPVRAEIERTMRPGSCGKLKQERFDVNVIF
jgi:IS30 family transposase